MANLQWHTIMLPVVIICKTLIVVKWECVCKSLTTNNSSRFSSNTEANASEWIQRTTYTLTYVAASYLQPHNSVSSVSRRSTQVRFRIIIRWQYSVRSVLSVQFWLAVKCWLFYKYSTLLSIVLVNKNNSVMSIWKFIEMTHE